MKMRFNERLEERMRLARDLHDTLLQTIQGIKMVADQAKGERSYEPAAANAFAQSHLRMVRTSFVGGSSGT